MVAGRVGKDSPATFWAGLPRLVAGQSVVCATELESSSALEVLTLDKHLAAADSVEGGRLVHRCSVRDTLEPERCLFDDFRTR